MENLLKELKLKRDNKYKIGKKMGNQLWFHKDYIDLIMSKKEFNAFESARTESFDYEIIRWDEKKQEIAFIECKDFNISNEPIVGKLQKITKKENGFEISKLINPPKDPLIYHHKWMFVQDDYSKFSVSESKQRSINWKTKLGVDKTISSKIGRLSFWNNWLQEQDLQKRTQGKKMKKKNIHDFIDKKLNKDSALPKVWQIYLDVSKTEQEISSANTARLQRPKTLKVMQATNLVEDGKKILDVGCGKGNKYFKEESEKMGFEYNGCDPFNQPKDINLKAIQNCMDGQADLVTLNNVLNTISEKEIRKSILQQCQNAINPETGKLMILTYEGEKLSSEKNKEKETGIKITELTPIKTRDGWQNRMKTESYVEEIESVFPNVKCYSVAGAKIIAASMNPDLDLDLRKRITKKRKPKIS